MASVLFYSIISILGFCTVRHTSVCRRIFNCKEPQIKINPSKSDNRTTKTRKEQAEWMGYFGTRVNTEMFIVNRTCVFLSCWYLVPPALSWPHLSSMAWVLVYWPDKKTFQTFDYTQVKISPTWIFLFWMCHSTLSKRLGNIFTGPFKPACIYHSLNHCQSRHCSCLQGALDEVVYNPVEGVLTCLEVKQDTSLELLLEDVLGHLNSPFWVIY